MKTCHAAAISGTIPRKWDHDARNYLSIRRHIFEEMGSSCRNYSESLRVCKKMRSRYIRRVILNQENEVIVVTNSHLKIC